MMLPDGRLSGNAVDLRILLLEDVSAALISGEDEDFDPADTAPDTTGISMHAGKSGAAEDACKSAPSSVPPWLPQPGAAGSKPGADDQMHLDEYMFPLSDSEVASKRC